MEIIKNIAAIVGCISAIIALGVTLIKPLRKGFVSYIRDKAQTSEQQIQIDELKEQISELNKTLSAFADEDVKCKNIILRSIEVLNEGMAMSLGNAIRGIYNSYKDGKIIPEKEYEVMDATFNVYANGLHKNGVIKRMHEEMREWQIV